MGVRWHALERGLKHGLKSVALPLTCLCGISWVTLCGAFPWRRFHRWSMFFLSKGWTEQQSFAAAVCLSDVQILHQTGTSWGVIAGLKRSVSKMLSTVHLPVLSFNQKLRVRLPLMQCRNRKWLLENRLSINPKVFRYWTKPHFPALVTGSIRRGVVL